MPLTTMEISQPTSDDTSMSENVDIVPASEIGASLPPRRKQGRKQDKGLFLSKSTTKAPQIRAVFSVAPDHRAPALTGPRPQAGFFGYNATLPELTLPVEVEPRLPARPLRKFATRTAAQVGNGEEVRIQAETSDDSISRPRVMQKSGISIVATTAQTSVASSTPTNDEAETDGDMREVDTQTDCSQHDEGTLRNTKNRNVYMQQRVVRESRYTGHDPALWTTSGTAGFGTTGRSSTVDTGDIDDLLTSLGRMDIKKSEETVQRSLQNGQKAMENERRAATQRNPRKVVIGGREVEV